MCLLVRRRLGFCVGLCQQLGGVEAAAPKPLPERAETTVVARMQEVCTIIDVFVFKVQLALKAIVFEDSDSMPHAPPTPTPAKFPED